MKDANLSSLLRVLMESDDAVTVNQLVNIGSNIVDGRYIAASPKALSFYGYDDPYAFSQTWRSLTEVYDYLIASLQVSAARLEDPTVPNRYITKLRQPNATEFPVIKETRQIYSDGISYWITSLRPADVEPNLHDVRDLADQLPSSSKVRPFGGYCIAEINKLLEGLELDQKKILMPDFSRDRIVRDEVFVNRASAMSDTMEERFVIVAKRDKDGYITCKRCGHRWKPSSVYPKLCSSCNQPWDRERVRIPYKKRKKVN